MKSILHWKARGLASLTAVALLGAAPALAQTIDGTRDASYPAALAVQTNETSFGNSTTGSVFNANGSELNNIHAQIVGSDLYIFIGGNLETNFNKLDLFFDTKSGGQNVLGNNGGNYVGAMNNLQFDAGFAADYALEVTTGNATATNAEVYANYAVLPTGGNGTTADFVGGGVGMTQTLNFSMAVPAGVGTGQVSINNSNTAGVGGAGGAATGNPGAVATGIEYRIPLSALGTTAGGGDIKIIAFVNGSNRDFISNQVLAGLPAGAGHAGPVGSVNFASQAGTQFVTVSNGAVATPADISVSPTTLNFFNVSTAAGSVTRQVTITNNGGSPLIVSSIVSSNPAFTASPTAATVAPAGTATITVTFDPSTAGAQTGNLTISSNDPGSPTVTVTMSGTGVAPGQVVIDGMVDSSLYGSPKALQTTPTGFGDNQSELNGAYARVTGTDLFLTLTGNLEAGGNKLVIFFDANPNSGQSTFSASNPGVDFGSSNNLAGLMFDRGFQPESFLSLNHSGGMLYANFAPMNGAGGNGTYLSGSSNAFTQPLDFGGGIMGELSFNNSNTAGVTDASVGDPGAVMTGVELRIPLSALGAGITGTTPIRVMALITNGAYDYLSNQALGGLPNGTGNLGLNGTGGGSLPNTVNFDSFTGNQFFTAQLGDLVVSSARDVSGEYNNITITGPNGAATFAGNAPVSAAGTVAVQNGGSLDIGTNLVGTGNLVIAAGATFRSATVFGPTGSLSGSVRNTGTRSYASDATYIMGRDGSNTTLSNYGLPASVRNITLVSSAGLNVNRPLTITGVLRVQNSAVVQSSGTLTLASSASETAMIINEGNGVVSGSAIVQRAIDPSLNSGPGYRHYSAPVQSTTFGDLATAGFTPNLNTAYNTAVNPGAVTPFPNVYGYDESRVVSSPAVGISDFDKGWFVPTGNMEVGRGYTVNIPASEVVDFVGTPNTGTVIKPLARVGGVNGGWHLVGNPYPSPIDWSLVASADRAGLDASMYVFESTSQYGGQYRSFVNGMGGGNPRIALGQGFFVRVAQGQTSGTLTFRNTQRITDTTVPFRRGTADARPQLHLQVRGAGLSDDAYVYFEAGATPAADASYDAVKLTNPNGLNLASVAGNEVLAINGLPALSTTTVVPLQVEVPAAGTYTLAAAALRNLPGAAYLLDATTGQRINLSQQASYTFAATSVSLRGRFAVVFEPAAAPLASNAAQDAARISVFPNPAHSKFTVLVPAAAKAAPLTVTMYNSLGQQVRRVAQSATSTEATAVAVDAAGLAAGVYTLRVQTGTSAPLTKRVVLE